MNPVTIPAWNSLGLLPPIDPTLPISPARSPYPVSLKDVVMRFSTSPKRQAVLKGFLGYRAELHRLGIATGFQWIDGSFFEDVETIEQRAPKDIDVVTFFHSPPSFDLSDADAQFFEQSVAKDRFKVDAYYVEFEQLTPRELAFWSAYWYSMWAHRRTQVWKGFLQIELADTDDAEALAWLIQTERTGAQ
jgi:hypothetical protein